MIFSKKTKGFTLIELAIAIAVIGIIVAMLFNKFGKSFITSAKAEAVYSNAKQVAETWKSLSMLCGVPLHPNSGTALSKYTADPYTGNEYMLSNPEDATYGIDTTKYRRCYAQSGFSGLSSIWKYKPGCAWGSWRCLYLGDYYGSLYKLTPETEGSVVVDVQVPNDIAEQLWLNYNPWGSTAYNSGTPEGGYSKSGDIYHTALGAELADHVHVILSF